MIDGIVEFLLERLAEDQDSAERAQPGPWVAVSAPMPGEMQVRHQMPDGRPDATVAVATTHGLRCSGGDARFIARHDPARVLAEVAAKQALLAAVDADKDPFDAMGAETAYESLVWEHLALAYASHPDYRPEWRP